MFGIIDATRLLRVSTEGNNASHTAVVIYGTSVNASPRGESRGRRRGGDGGEGDDAAAARAREERSLALRDEIRGAITHALTLANERVAHVPPVTRAGAVSFPFEISLPGDGASGTLGTLRRVMLASSPPAMLT